MKDWTELKITVPVSELETAAASAQLIAGGGLYIEDYSRLEEETQEIAHIDLIDEELLAKDRKQAVLHLYFSPDVSPAEPISWLGRRLTESGVRFTMETDEVRELDWATAWKQYYHPIELSQRLAICPTWEEYSPKPDQQVIRLDPGMAFGTGTHETTRLCLALMERYARPGMRLLDVGTGSGILAICGKLLGCGETLGVDIDETAVRTAKENAALNGCDIAFLKGDLAKDVKGRYDMVCANIIADAIIKLSADLPALMEEDGVCILSGIIDERLADVEAALAQTALIPVAVEERGGWVAIACQKQRG